MDASSDGDLIWVTNGLYASGGRPAGTGTTTNRVAIDRVLTVRSVNGPLFTLIEGRPHGAAPNQLGPAAVRCVYVTDGAVLDGFTLTNGFCGGENSPDWTGGGAYCRPGGILTNCDVVACMASTEGGGVYRGVARNCRIRGCWTHSGAWGGGGGAAYTILEGGEVSGCHSVFGQGGGLLFATATRVLVSSNLVGAASGGGVAGGATTDCRIEYNACLAASPFGGGGVYGGSHVGGVLAHNTAPLGGGAYEASLSNCILSNNVAGYGGGAHRAQIADCLLTHNHARYEGGGAHQSTIRGGRVEWNLAGTNQSGHTYGYGGGLHGGSACETEIAHNEALLNGGGAYAAALTNCIVASNRADHDVFDAGRGGGCASCTVVGGVITGNWARCGGGASGSNLEGAFLANNQANVRPDYSMAGGGGGACQSRLTVCVITENIACYGGHGGGLYDCAASRCRIDNNVASNLPGMGVLGSGLGGGAYGGALTNCVIHTNTANAGAGMAMGTVVYCTLADNTARYWGGGGIYGGTAVCSIVYQNHFPLMGPTATNRNHAASVLQDCCTTPGQPGNINVNPGFVWYDTLYRLRDDSPCRDAVTNAATVEDYSGYGRPLDGHNIGHSQWILWDIGAHEYVHPDADTDKDGMPDAWEAPHGLNLIADDSALDLDADGQLNLGELLAGTDPRDPASALQLLTPCAASGGVAVSWASVTGRTYTLERATSPQAAGWTNVADNVAATAPLNTVTDLHTTAATVYRIRLH